jgi:hypothetical protein
MYVKLPPIPSEEEKMKAAYEEYFKERMKDKEFADYVNSLGYGITGLHNMLFTFFRAGFSHGIQSTLET